MFLRADSFDVKATAQRIMLHFQCKLQLWGIDLLVKDITQNDLDDKCLELLKEGSTQKLPIKDSAGRTIIVSCWNYLPISIKYQIQLWWYMTMSCVFDDDDGVVVVGGDDDNNTENDSDAIDTQRKGIVYINYLVQYKMREVADQELLSWGAKYV